MASPAIPLPAARSIGGRAKSGVDRDGRLVEAWLRGHTLLVYVFLYLPIVVVVVFSFNGTARRVTQWDGLSLRWYETVLASKEIQGYLRNSLIVGSIHRGHLDDHRDDGRARPRADAEVVPPPVRCADLRQHHRAGARHRPGDARLLRQHDRPGRDCHVADRRPLRVRVPHDRAGACRCSTSASSCSSSGPACPGWTGPTSRRATTCTARRGGRSGRSRSRSSCPRSWRASCCRSRSPSTTT